MTKIGNITVRLAFLSINLRDDPLKLPFLSGELCDLTLDVWPKYSVVGR